MGDGRCAGGGREGCGADDLLLHMLVKIGEIQDLNIPLKLKMRMRWL